MSELVRFVARCRYLNGLIVVDRVITDFNGDVTLWSVYYIKGLIKYRIGSLIEARSAFERSLYFNTAFEPARQELAKVNQIMEEHGSITIRFNKKNMEKSNNQKSLD